MLPDTISKAHVYSSVSAKVKDTHKESLAEWDDRAGRMESMKESIKQNFTHYIVAPPDYKHRITIWGTVIILFEEDKEQWMEKSSSRNS